MLDAILLGILQGLTEFLPISSSGHLVLGQALLGSPGHGDQGILFEVLLHLGTLLAVLIAYRHDVRDLALALFPAAWSGMDPLRRRRNLRLLLFLVVASIPAGLVGFTLKDTLEGFFQNPETVAFLLLGTALILAVGDRLKQGQRTAEDAGPGRSLSIGVAQAFAILPGISRSGSTLVAGIAMGLRPVEAARFSFLISIPAVSGAALLEAKDLFTGVASITMPSSWLVAGFLSSTVVGYISLQWLLIAVRRRSLSWFSAYCAVAGLGFLLYRALA